MTNQPTEFKSVPTCFWEVKEEDKDQGIVEHLISLFGVLDMGGDICHPGAFTKTLQEREDQIRVLDMHRRQSTLNAVGVPLKLWEVSRAELPPEVLKKYPESTGGLKARTQFLLDTPEGKGIFVRIKAGAVKEFSFAYDTLDSDLSDLPDGTKARNLRTLRLWEYGPTLFGMMPGAQAISAKSASAPPEEETTENTIRIRVHTGKFKEGSFRVINVGDKDNGILALIGRLEGETATTVRSYIFDKEKWSAERARKWVNEHKKALLLFVPELKEDEEEVGGPEECICPKCKHEQKKKKGEPCRSLKCPKCGTKMIAKVEEDDDKSLVQVLEIEMAQLELEIGAGPA